MPVTSIPAVDTPPVNAATSLPGVNPRADTSGPPAATETAAVSPADPASATTPPAAGTAADPASPLTLPTPGVPAPVAPSDAATTPATTPAAAAAQGAAPYPMPGGDLELKLVASGTTGGALRKRAAVTGGIAGFGIAVSQTGAVLRRQAVITGGSAGLGAAAAPTGSPITMHPAQTAAPSASAPVAAAVTATGDSLAPVAADNGKLLEKRAPDSSGTASSAPTNSAVQELLESAFNSPQVSQKRSPDATTGTESYEPSIDPVVQQYLKTSFKSLYWQSRAPSACFGSRAQCDKKFTHKCNMMIRFAYKHGCSHTMVKHMIDAAGLKHTAPPPGVKEKRSPVQLSGWTAGADSPNFGHDTNEKLEIYIKATMSYRDAWQEFSEACELSSKAECEEHMKENIGKMAHLAYRKGYGVDSSNGQAKIAGVPYTAPRPIPGELNADGEDPGLSPKEGIDAQHDEIAWRAPPVNAPTPAESVKVEKLLKSVFKLIHDNQDLEDVEETREAIINSLSRYAYQRDFKQNAVTGLLEAAGLNPTATSRAPKNAGSRQGHKEHDDTSWIPHHPPGHIMYARAAGTKRTTTESSTTDDSSSVSGPQGVMKKGFAYVHDVQTVPKTQGFLTAIVHELVQYAHESHFAEITIKRYLEEAEIDHKLLPTSSENPSDDEDSRSYSGGTDTTSYSGIEGPSPYKDDEGTGSYGSRIFSSTASYSSTSNYPYHSTSTGSSYGSSYNWRYDSNSYSRTSTSSYWDRGSATASPYSTSTPRLDHAGGSDGSYRNDGYEKRSEPSVSTTHTAETTASTPTDAGHLLARHAESMLDEYLPSKRKTDGNGTVSKVAGVKRTSASPSEQLAKRVNKEKLDKAEEKLREKQRELDEQKAREQLAAGQGPSSPKVQGPASADPGVRAGGLGGSRPATRIPSSPSRGEGDRSVSLIDGKMYNTAGYDGHDAAAHLWAIEDFKRQNCKPSGSSSKQPKGLGKNTEIQCDDAIGMPGPAKPPAIGGVDAPPRGSRGAGSGSGHSNVKRTPGWKERAKEVAKNLSRKKGHTGKHGKDDRKMELQIGKPVLQNNEKELRVHPGLYGDVNKQTSGNGGPSQVGAPGGSNDGAGNGQGYGSNQASGSGQNYGAGSDAQPGTQGASNNQPQNFPASGYTQVDRPSIGGYRSSDCTSHPSASECSDVFSGMADVGAGEGDIMHEPDGPLGSGAAGRGNGVGTAGSRHHNSDVPQGFFKRSPKIRTRNKKTDTPKGGSNTPPKGWSTTSDSGSSTASSKTTADTKLTIAQFMAMYCIPPEQNAIAGGKTTNVVCELPLSHTAGTGTGTVSTAGSGKGQRAKELGAKLFDHAKEAGAVDTATKHLKGLLGGKKARRDSGSAQPSTGPYPRRDAGVVMNSGTLNARQEAGVAQPTGAINARRNAGSAQASGGLNARQEAGAAQATGAINARRQAGVAQASGVLGAADLPSDTTPVARHSPTPTAAMAEPVVKRYVATVY